MKKLLLSLATAFIAISTQAQISVTATAGTTTGTYATVKGAFDAINAGNHQGAITILVNSDTFETASAVLNASNAPASYTSVLIKPNVGVNATISGAIATAIIRLNAADNVTIDGSNNGSSSRNLNITNKFAPPAGSLSRVLWINSTSSNGTDNATIKNTNLAATISAGVTTCISLSGFSDSIANVANNNFNALNNTFKRAALGIFGTGTLAYSDTGWVIRNNELGSTIEGDKLLFTGITVQAAKNFEISGNVITGVISSSPRMTTGIYLGASSDGSVFNNKISDIKNSNAGGAAGLQLSCGTTANTNIIVYNNIISDVAGTGNTLSGAVGDNGNGIVVTLGAGYKIYHNTVVMNANQIQAGRPAAFNVGVDVTAAGAIDLRNNIFVNSQTQAGEKYAIYSNAPTAVFSNIDYNNYYTTGSNLGYIGSARATLADVQAGFGGNLNSLNIMPAFMSATDLHLSASGNTALDNKATPLAEVTSDADGIARSAATPDLGSFEFSSTASVQDNNKRKISYYPNAVVDYLQIKHNNTINSVEIYTLAAQSAGTANINASEGSVDMRRLAAGVYILKVNTDNGSESIKIIKK